MDFMSLSYYQMHIISTVITSGILFSQTEPKNATILHQVQRFATIDSCMWHRQSQSSNRLTLWVKTGKLWRWTNASTSIFSGLDPFWFFSIGCISTRLVDRQHEIEEKVLKHVRDVMHSISVRYLNQSFQKMDWQSSNMYWNKSRLRPLKNILICNARIYRQSITSSPDHHETVNWQSLDHDLQSEIHCLETLGSCIFSAEHLAER
jgi:hypothetical protein